MLIYTQQTITKLLPNSSQETWQWCSVLNFGLLKGLVEVNGATAEQKQCQRKETQAPSYALVLILRSTVGTESLPSTVLQLEQKIPPTFTGLSVTAY